MRWMAGVVALALMTPGTMWGQGNGNGGVDGGGAPPPSAAPWEAPPMALTRISGPIQLDGRPDEEAWLLLPTLEMVQHWPEFRGGVDVPSRVRVGYDDEFLYAAAWFQEVPGGVRGNSLRRDRWEGDDTFSLVVDSFNDDETALRFAVTPLGVQIDQEIRNDAQFAGSSEPLNQDWNTFWDAATTRTDDGWFAEMRIPLASLGFSARDGEAVMGIIASRYRARTDETFVYPAIPPNWDMANFKPSRARDVRLEGVTEQRALWVAPYLLTGVERIREPDAAVVAAPTSDIPYELGGDVKVGLSSNLTLDLTVNTDFAQVEADALQVNLDRFGLFFPEKRQFFQERSSAFEFDLGEGRLFHSRRIGLSEGGDPLRILGGARLSGRMGEWDVGVLSMQVDGGGLGPGENDGVLRLKRSVGEQGYLGGMLTTRLLEGGGADVAAGADGRVGIGPDLVTIQVAHTRNETDPATGAVAPGMPAESGTLARVFWERRNRDGLGYDFDLLYSGDGYRPALGFESRHDYSALRGRVLYTIRPEAGGLFTSVTLVSAVRAYRRNADGALESGLIRARSWATLRGGHFANIALNFFREDVAEGFSLPGADVPAGTYDGWDVFTRFQLNDARRLGFGITVWGGTLFDGWRTTTTIDPWWRLNRHLTLGGEFTLNRFFFPDRDQTVNADVAQLRVSAALNTHLSAEAFVQYSAAADAVGTNLRIRYRFSEGRDLFVVLDEGRDLEDRFGLDSALLGRTDRRLLVKYVWTFRP